VPLTLSGASDAIGVPREEIRRIELRAMEKLGWVNLVG
jgi:DNA-directed RNA polymerase sigma subunit (sigma70/sigma32)